MPNRIKHIFALFLFFNEKRHAKTQKNSNPKLRTFKIAIIFSLFDFYPYPFGGPYLPFARFQQCSVFITTHSGGPYLSFALFRQCSIFYIMYCGGPYLSFARFHQCSVFSLTHCGGPYLPFALFQRLLPFSCLDIQISIYLNSHELALIMRIVNLSCAMESPPVYCKIPISI